MGWAMSKAESFEIQGADGHPIHIPAGEFYFNSKARCRRMMLNSLSADARRVYACLELATMGFQREDAVVMERGKIRPMTPGDVANQTGLDKQRVRAGLEELENEGLAKRESDDGNPLRKGHVRLYSWVEPHPTRPNIKEVARAGYFPSWFPDSWEPFRPLINRFKMRLIPDEVAARSYFEEGARVARCYQEAEELAARFLEGVCAHPAHNKEERTEKTDERKTESPAAAAVVQQDPAPAAAADKQSVESQNQTPDNAEAEALATELRKYAGPLVSLQDARQLLKACRNRDVTSSFHPPPRAVEVLAVCKQKIKNSGEKWREITNPIGYFLATVPPYFPDILNTLRPRRE
jgi:hypothetical protein